MVLISLKLTADFIPVQRGGTFNKCHSAQAVPGEGTSLGAGIDSSVNKLLSAASDQT
jgi:hypothetical protein